MSGNELENWTQQDMEKIVLERNIWKNAFKVLDYKPYKPIQELKDAIDGINQDCAALQDLTGEQWGLEEIIDLSDLPSSELASNVDTSYPIWACDNKGDCLVGDSMDRIENIDEILKYQEECREEFKRDLEERKKKVTIS